MRQAALHAPSLEANDEYDVPSAHPVAVLRNVYNSVQEQLFGHHMPALQSIMDRSPPGLLERTVFLEPIAAHPYIDYLPIKRGNNVYGDSENAIERQIYYSDTIAPQFVMDRLMEITSCIALKKPRIASAMSARKGVLNMKVIRGLYPVHNTETYGTVVILLVAPPYVEIDPE